MNNNVSRPTRMPRTKLVGYDPETDLASIKADARRDLPAVRLGDSHQVQVGDWASAIVGCGEYLRSR